MNLEGNLTSGEIRRRKKISRYRKRVIKEKRERGYRAWLAARRREIRKRKTREKHEKEKLKKLKQKEKQKLLLWKKKHRKIGRPKKRGPKKKIARKKKWRQKKKAKRMLQKLPNFEYKIIQYRNGKHTATIGAFNSLYDTYKKLNELLKESDNVIFKANIDARELSMQEAVDEYAIITNIPPENNTTNGFRNDFGKIIHTELNSKHWFLLDKVRFNQEETFWVWGYDKWKDRKNFLWIYNNLLMSGIETKYDFKRVMTFRNKVIFKNDNGHIDLIFCKHTSDAIKFYNKLQEFAKLDKLKQILFFGDHSKLSPTRKALEDDIFALTGWPLKKIRMSSTTFYTKKKKPN